MKAIIFTLAFATAMAGIERTSSEASASRWSWALRKIDSRAPGGFRELSRHATSRECSKARKQLVARDPKGSYGCMKVPS